MKQIFFPIHLQQHDNTCGPACMAMIAEWATGLPQSEYIWCKKIKHNRYGVSSLNFNKSFNLLNSDKSTIEVDLDSSVVIKPSLRLKKFFQLKNRAVTRA